MRAFHILLSLPLLFGSALSASARQEPQLTASTGVHIEVHRGGEELRLTIEARQIPAETLMKGIARKMSLELTGFELIAREARIDAFLHDLPFKDAIRWTLGSVGLRADIDGRRIAVAEDIDPFPVAFDVLQRANTRYVYALRTYPDWPLADRAEMARAEINEQLGPDFWGAALLGYDTVVRDHPSTDLAPYALLHAGQLMVRMGRWHDAVLRFERLANLDLGHPYHAIARLEMARSLCHVGEGAKDPSLQEESGVKALHYLDALDNAYPTDEPSERRQRLLVRSRAYSISNQYILALKALDNATRYSVSGNRDSEVLELRAMAFTHAELHGSAATAWLAHATLVTGEERQASYLRAADEALAGGHELATLAIYETALKEGMGEALASAANLARLRLGLLDGPLGVYDAQQHLVRGKELMKRRMYKSAAGALRLAFDRRDQLTPVELVELARVYAKALDRDAQLDEAMYVLRTVTSGLQSPTRRSELYWFASKLYENHNLLDEAIEALQGRL